MSEDAKEYMTDPQANPLLAPGLQAINICKRFGSLVALDNVSMTVRPGTFHALLGGNGAGKSTLVKCIMGYYLPDDGEIVVGQRKEVIKNPREALALGIGMVYQHFTLVGNMTVAENLVLSRGKISFAIDWEKEKNELRAFLRTTPFFIPLDARVNSLAAGQKQKLEIVKQLYLKNRILFLDEPTSVLTPQEADEVLTTLKKLTLTGNLSVLIITHKFSQVMKFADDFTVLRTGKLVGAGRVKDYTAPQMAEMMIGSQQTATIAQRSGSHDRVPQLTMDELAADDDAGVAAFEDLSLYVHAGEIVAVVGVSGNGQSELVQVLAGQRPVAAGTLLVKGKPYRGTRREINAHKVYCLPEEPLRNACVGPMGVGANMALRRFDGPPITIGKLFVNPRQIRKFASHLITRYRVKTPSHSTPIRTLSGGNVQRAVLARELSGEVNVLIAQNPCFGLDFAAVADIRAQIMDARNRGAAVLLVTEDLDEAFELADRIVVMFDGRFVYQTPIAEADIAVIGRHMAGHADASSPGAPATPEVLTSAHEEIER
ncbi:MAG TPA: ABC transporter ATP-binding protein [Phycisphaerae bacterium]|nr:ABC transporter ATP-binding protein [Phycisphaerae bacterium]